MSTPKKLPAQAKEISATTSNIKENKLLKKNVQNIKIEQSYKLKLLEIDEKIARTKLRRLQEKVTKIRSHLTPDEIYLLQRNLRSKNRNESDHLTVNRESENHQQEGGNSSTMSVSSLPPSRGRNGAAGILNRLTPPAFEIIGARRTVSDGNGARKAGTARARTASHLRRGFLSPNVTFSVEQEANSGEFDPLAKLDEPDEIYRSRSAQGSSIRARSSSAISYTSPSTPHGICPQTPKLEKRGFSTLPRATKVSLSFNSSAAAIELAQGIASLSTFSSHSISENFYASLLNSGRSSNSISDSSLNETMSTPSERYETRRQLLIDENLVLAAELEDRKLAFLAAVKDMIENGNRPKQESEDRPESQSMTEEEIDNLRQELAHRKAQRRQEKFVMRKKSVAFDDANDLRKIRYLRLPKGAEPDISNLLSQTLVRKQKRVSEIWDKSLSHRLLL